MNKYICLCGNHNMPEEILDIAFKEAFKAENEDNIQLAQDFIKRAKKRGKEAKMKTAEEIFEDARLCDDIPNYHNVLEINCFMSLRILLKQFYNKHISKEQATNLKNKIYKKYNDNKKQYEFEENMFKEHISNIAKTSDLRILLRHQLNEQSEYSLETALKLIELYSNERWEICGENKT